MSVHTPDLDQVLTVAHWLKEHAVYFLKFK